MPPWLAPLQLVPPLQLVFVPSGFCSSVTVPPAPFFPDQPLQADLPSSWAQLGSVRLAPARRPASPRLARSFLSCFFPIFCPLSLSRWLNTAFHHRTRKTGSNLWNPRGTFVPLSARMPGGAQKVNRVKTVFLAENSCILITKDWKLAPCFSSRAPSIGAAARLREYPNPFLC